MALRESRKGRAEPPQPERAPTGWPVHHPKKLNLPAWLLKRRASGGDPPGHVVWTPAADAERQRAERRAPGPRRHHARSSARVARVPAAMCRCGCGRILKAGRRADKVYATKQCVTRGWRNKHPIPVVPAAACRCGCGVILPAGRNAKKAYATQACMDRFHYRQRRKKVVVPAAACRCGCGAVLPEGRRQDHVYATKACQKRVYQRARMASANERQPAKG